MPMPHEKDGAGEALRKKQSLNVQGCSFVYSDVLAYHFLTDIAWLKRVESIHVLQVKPKLIDQFVAVPVFPESMHLEMSLLSSPYSPR